MKAKEYLQQLQRLDIVINQKLNELNDLRLKSRSTGSIDYSKERVKSSHASDAPFVKLVGRIIDLEREIDSEIVTFVNKKHKIINQIQALKNKDHISVLHKRYVEYKKFEAISTEMSFTYQYVIEMHGSALKEFEKTYGNL